MFILLLVSSNRELLNSVHFIKYSLKFCEVKQESYNNDVSLFVLKVWRHKVVLD